MKGLSNEQIDSFVKGNIWMKPFYIGCFPSCHNIKIPKRRRTSFITNTDHHSKSGQHWNAWVVLDKTVYFMDTFGRSPLDVSFPHDYRHIVGMFNNFKYFPYRIQPFDSYTCGFFCIHFILIFSVGLNMSNFKKEYTKNVNENDVKVINILNSLI